MTDLILYGLLAVFIAGLAIAECVYVVKIALYITLGVIDRLRGREKRFQLDLTLLMMLVLCAVIPGWILGSDTSDISLMTYGFLAVVMFFPLQFTVKVIRMDGYLTVLPCRTNNYFLW